MNHEFLEFGSYTENGIEVKHFICDEYHFWIWVEPNREISRFELHYRDWRVKYHDGSFLQGSEDYIMPAFFLIDLQFNCNPDLKAQLLAIRDSFDSSARDVALTEGKKAKRSSIHGFTF